MKLISEKFSLWFRQVILYIFLLETASFLAHFYPVFGDAVLFVLIAFVLFLALYRFEDAVLILLAELFIGSQGGYLFELGAEAGLHFSLRMALFTVVFSVWAAKTAVALISRRTEGLAWYRFLRQEGILWPYVAFLAVLAATTLNGLLRHNSFNYIASDANGYKFFALLPALIAALSGQETRQKVVAILAATVSWSLAKALFVFYVFSHRIMTLAPDLYVWIRDSRVGEITKMVGDFYRVFFQSHVYALPAFFVTLVVLLYLPSWKTRAGRWLWAVFIFAATSIIMGFSRSFWFGCATAVAAVAALLIWTKAERRIWSRLALLGLVGVFGAGLILATVYSIPFPRKGQAVSFAALIGSRALSLGNEAAANSRWALLPKLAEAGMKHPVLGSGFGTTVTYKTSDPRLLADIPTGEYTTYAFEWGYLDLWVKFGLVGLAAYAWLLWAMLRPLWRGLRESRASLARIGGGTTGANEKPAIFAGLLLTIVALLATNVFSPYLNHPLGIGLIMLISIFGFNLAESHGTGHSPESKTEPGKSR